PETDCFAMPEWRFSQKRATILRPGFVSGQRPTPSAFFEISLTSFALRQTRGVTHESVPGGSEIPSLLPVAPFKQHIPTDHPLGPNNTCKVTPP
ncbi:MAG: hypothetical protein KDA96_19985, partial [Planctomycetaceae bacterium]|nr:hypothetical protein [Planctomycetaceae bacterium]